MKKTETSKKTRPPQHQDRAPGFEWQMHPHPKFYNPTLLMGRKLGGKVAIVSGGDSGIGKAVAVNFAAHGAKVVILYLNEDRDATDTSNFIEKITGVPALIIPCDVSDERNCHKAVHYVMQKYGKIDILVNNAGIHFPVDDFLDISKDQLETTFSTNIFSMFYLTQAVLPHMKRGSSIINTASVTAYRGSKNLVDYAASKGAIVAFTRSLSTLLADKGIRVNGVAPGPIWTPLIPSSFEAEDVQKLGSGVPLKRPGEPVEVATSYVFLASEDSTYMTGQFLHPNGGEIVNA